MTFELPSIRLGVALEDGDGPPLTWEVTTDQRDMRRADVTCGIHDPEADRIGYTFALAWAALTRTGQIEIGWPEFQARCLGALPLDVDGAGLDPTARAPGAGS